MRPLGGTKNTFIYASSEYLVYFTAFLGSTAGKFLFDLPRPGEISRLKTEKRFQPLESLSHFYKILPHLFGSYERNSQAKADSVATDYELFKVTPSEEVGYLYK